MMGLSNNKLKIFIPLFIGIITGLYAESAEKKYDRIGRYTLEQCADAKVKYLTTKNKSEYKRIGDELKNLKAQCLTAYTNKCDNLSIKQNRKLPVDMRMQAVKDCHRDKKNICAACNSR